MKKTVSLMLVFLLLLGMTAMALPDSSTPATATTYYYKQDFSQYATTNDAAANYLAFYNAEVNTAGPAAISHTDAVYDIATHRATGKNVFFSGSYAAANNVAGRWYNIGTNGAGAPTLTTNQNSHSISFIPSTSWDGSIKTNESYVISMDMSATTAQTNDGTFLALFTKRGNATEPAINRVRMASSYATGGTYGGLRPNTTQWGYGGNGDFKANDMPTTFAVKLTYDTTNNRLKRDWYQDATVWNLDCVYDMENTTTVEGFTYKFRVGLGVADVKMYTINNDVDFKAETVETGAVSPTTDKVTVKINRPIYEPSLVANQITMKKGDAAFTDFELGDVKTVVNGTEIYTAIEILFDKTLAQTETYSVIIPSTVKDEIGNALGTTNNVATFETDAYPTFETGLTAEGMIPGDDLDVLVNKNTTFNAAFENTTAAPANAVVFVGIYNSSDELVGYTFAKTNFAANATQNVGLCTKVEGTDMYVKALAFGCLEDFFAGIDFNTTNVEIN